MALQLTGPVVSVGGAEDLGCVAGGEAGVVLGLGVVTGSGVVGFGVTVDFGGVAGKGLPLRHVPNKCQPLGACGGNVRDLTKWYNRDILT